MGDLPPTAQGWNSYGLEVFTVSQFQAVGYGFVKQGLSIVHLPGRPIAADDKFSRKVVSGANGSYKMRYSSTYFLEEMVSKTV